MKKFLKILLTIIVVIAVLFCVLFIVVRLYGDKIISSYADKLYEKKDYAYAYTLYDALCLYKPENTEYKNKLTKCLIKMPFTYSVQKKLLEIAQSDNSSYAETMATDKIKHFRNTVSQKYGDNYITDAVNGQIVLHWSKNSFPLKFYIEPMKEVPEYYEKEAEQSFEAWQRESDEFISFKKVNNPAASDIIIKFRPTATGNSKHQQGEYAIALTSPVVENEKLLKQMNIVCSMKTHTDEFLTPQQIKTVITHEIGHALGIWGHPKDNKTVMYYSMDNPYDIYENRIDTSITGKDISTIKLLYSLYPNITNSHTDLTNKEKFIYPKILFEPLDDALNKSINNAKEMLKNHPDDLSYALSLADAYNSAGKHKESIDLMIFLANNTGDKNLLNILYYNISNNYLSIKDLDNALLYATKAKALHASADNICLVAYIKYCKGDLSSAEKDFTYLLNKNPGYLNASLGLADVYIKKHQYSKARKVLKELLKYNPDALEDKALNAYKLLIAF